jgi:redox-sensitive bicupin YhaK (pirin superfamily)
MAITIAFRKIINATKLNFKPAFTGLSSVDIFASQLPIEPFLVFTEYKMDRPVFGPHPHAGISVMTYVLPDSKGGFINRDSRGDFSEIEPGGLHITQAGKGIQHDEFPKITGVETHGFQIWINHADKHRLVDSKAMHANAHEIPEVNTRDFSVRILHGSFQGKSARHQMVTPVTLLHITLKSSHSIVLDGNEMAFAYVIAGEGKSDGKIITANELVNYDTSDQSIQLTAGDTDLEFMFATATPLKEPIVYGGPFVMTTAEQMNDTKKRYARGEMGPLEPYQN